jgi:fibronectin type 3 domain-containing protein
MTLGQKLYENTFHVNIGNNILKLQPNVPTGAYVIKVQIGDKVVSSKIIKD